MLSRLPGKISRCDVDFVKCRQEVLPLSVYVGQKLFRSSRSCLSASEISVPGKNFRVI